jgi:predicted metal-binding membrane protein
VHARADVLRISAGGHPAVAPAVATGAVAAVAWVIVVGHMNRMDVMGGGLSALPSFVGIWTVMMAAMMLPSAVPVVAAVARASSLRDRGPTAPALLAAVYILVWGAFGGAVYVVREVLAAAGPPVSWQHSPSVLAGVAITVGGLYALTPLKRACQANCRALSRAIELPESGVLRAALACAASYSGRCVGSSVGLMVALLAVGLTSITCMVIVSLIVFIEKVVPLHPRIDTAIALLLVAFGAWVAFWPSSMQLLMAVP